ncbi:hypothetical protein PR202_gb15027 [Eleusine coracana subsp. coracana]|uniref:AAA+ ATPase domain-containing protein n=1 Tax=Eleusine coracana subsp. coracana TaxID=191504 RepID=A0AAV5EYC4_ELECO|nr:hypothetical protein QOZ80_4BG0341970 [Eleusine coracana subsp. coracana]GJN27046.1 hypothetical protein PR202_gb15027 [Eleusine coracana subsp. coracana]
MVEAAGSCLQPLWECLDGTGMIDVAKQKISSFLRLKSNWSDLDKARDSLQAIEMTVKAEVTRELDKLNICDPQVQVWLNRVEELQLDTIDEDYSQFMEYSCLCQCTMHAGRRACTGKRVVEALEEVNKLIDEGRGFKKFGFKPLPDIVEHLPQIETFGLESMLTQLHDLLEKSDSSVIGVWGQGGIGKTTLLHIFNNDLGRKAHDYQVVIFIEVSNSETLNTVDIQQTISERLNLPWNEAEAVEKRAKFLVKALARKRFVVLLDDMGAQRSLIKMQVLDAAAAWNLFLSKLSNEASAAVKSPNSNNVVRERAKVICKSCGGLPLALNIVGTAVAGLEEPDDWISAADAITVNMDSIDGVDEMFAQLKYSYDRLTPTQQKCFLYCALFPEYGSISKEQLVDYWLAEGFLLNDCENGYQIIRSLVSACLLQTSGSMSSKVKMHHVTRRLGIWLVNKTDQKFLVQAGMALDNAPSPQKWKGPTRISIMFNDIKELSFSPKCKNLTTLLVQNNPNLNKLSLGFFKFMPTLKVLDLSHTAITLLPECETLVALQHLNLSHTNITVLPERLWLLKELRHLDLSVTGALEDTLDNCSKLHKLRVLNLFRSHYGIHDVNDLNLDSLKALLFLGITIYSEDVLKKLNKTNPLAKPTHRLNLKYCREMHSMRISDLNHMEHLEELYIESCYDLTTLVSDAELTTSCLQFLTLSVLPSLENVIVEPMPHHFRYVRKLVIMKCPKLQNITWILRLEMLERLVVSHCDEVVQIVDSDENSGVQKSNGQDHPSEEQEDLHNEQDCDYQITSVSESSDGAARTDFLKLRSIVLTDLKKLKSICKPRDFPSLDTIRVEDCPNLRNIPLSSTHDFGKLKQVCGSFDWWEKLRWEDKKEAAQMESKYFIPI